ncbi:MAG: ABC transporter permease, partial [bacterium]
MRMLTELTETLKLSVATVYANRSRGLLTTLGIIIGIVAVVTTMTAANGLGNSFKESISAIGSDVLYISRMPWVMRGNWFEFRNRKNLELDYAADLKRHLSYAAAINPTTSTAKSIKYRSNVLYDVRIIGSTDKHIMVSSSLPEFGRFMTDLDVQYKRKVCVIGTEIKKQLFDNADPINKKMSIGRDIYRVVGVMEKQGSAGFFGGPNFDNQIYIPITSFLSSFGGGADRNFDIAVKAPSHEGMDDFEYALIGEMRKIRKLKPIEKDDFSINKLDSLMAAYNNVMGVIVLIGLLITGISLFVG